MPIRPVLSRAPIDLVERRTELAAVEAALDRVPEEGQVVMVRGIAGIGKTSLLEHAAASAAARGWTVRSARGDELEADFAFGVVLQLLESAAAERGGDDLFEGPAGLARPLLTPGGEPLPDDAALFSILHGLYWFVANLADRGPLVLMVDDAHWADVASLRWAHYLAKRIAEHPIALIVGCRPVSAGPIGRILGSLPAHTVIEPRPLSAEGVAEVVRSSRPDVATAQADHWYDLTGGVPLFVRELLRVGDTLHSADAAVDESLQTVRARLDRLDPAARRLVEAAAVLGDGAPTWQAERLAGIAPGDDAIRRALVEAAILDDELEVCFTHPAVREAVERSIAPTEARRLHGAAVALLVEADASAELVAHHLMASPPGTSSHAVEVLERAARRARLTGSPDQAATWLRRALAEAPAEPVRARLLAELAVADAAAGDERWSESVDRAVQAAVTPAAAAEVRLRVGRALAGRGWLDRAAEVLRAALDDPRADDPGELRLELLAALAAASRIDVSRRVRLDEELAAALDGADLDASPAARAVLAHLTYDRALSAHPADEVRRMGRAAILHPAIDDREVLESSAAYQALLALHFADDAAAVDEVLDQWFDVAARRANEMLFGLASNARCTARLAQGRIRDALADGEAAVEVMLRDRRVTVVGAAGNLALTRLEQDDLAGAQAALDLPDPEPHWRTSASYTHWLHCRAVIRLAQGDDAGLDDAAEVVRRQRAIGAVNPATIPAPFTLAAALATDRPSEARTLLEEAEVAAEKFGAARTLSMAARTRAVLEPERAEVLLERAEALVAEGPWGLDRMEARVALGRHRLGRGAKAEAREPLRLALAEADAVGAARLAREARDLLLATGARPRRTAVSGPDALTPTERAVAQLAVDGLSNREIAARRFVSVKAVEYHLANAYRKLGISSRSALSGALGS